MLIKKRLHIIVVLLILCGSSPAWARPTDLTHRIASLADFISGLLGKKQTTTVIKVVLPYDYFVRQAARRYGLDPALVHSIIRHESNYNPQAVSSRGAQGLMQLMPATAQAMRVRNAFNPQQNINGGSKYYAQLLAEFKNHKKALTAYNYGPGKVRKGLSCRESRVYVRRVLKTWYNLRENYQKN